MTFTAPGTDVEARLSSSMPDDVDRRPKVRHKHLATIPTLSRKFVARRISEGETGRLKEELKCQACGKGYKHISSLAKHLWEHTPEWSMTSKLLISKHQQVQLLEAASILVSMNEEDEENEKNEIGTPGAGGHADEFGSNSYSSHTLPPEFSDYRLALASSPAQNRYINVPGASRSKSIFKASQSYGGRRTSVSAFPPSSVNRHGSVVHTPVTDSLIPEPSSAAGVDYDPLSGLATPLSSTRRMSHVRRRDDSDDEVDLKYPDADDQDGDADGHGDGVFGMD